MVSQFADNRILCTYVCDHVVCVGLRDLKKYEMAILIVMVINLICSDDDNNHGVTIRRILHKRGAAKAGGASLIGQRGKTGGGHKSLNGFVEQLMMVIMMFMIVMMMVMTMAMMMVTMMVMRARPHGKTRGGQGV